MHNNVKPDCIYPTADIQVVNTIYIPFLSNYFAFSVRVSTITKFEYTHNEVGGGGEVASAELYVLCGVAAEVALAIHRRLLYAYTVKPL